MAYVVGTVRGRTPRSLSNPLNVGDEQIEEIITSLDIWARAFDLNFDHIAPHCRKFATFKSLTSSIKEWSNFLMCKMLKNDIAKPDSNKFMSSSLYRHLLRCTYRPSDRQRRMIVSLLMVKKGFPEAPIELVEETLQEHRETLSRPSKTTDPRIVEFTRNLVDKLFPRGWDKKASCGALPSKAVYEGGVATNYVSPVPCVGLFSQARHNYVQFLNTIRHYRVKAVAVQQPGKIRVITKSEYSLKCLMPLQNAIMTQLRRQKCFVLTKEEMLKEHLAIFNDEKGQWVSGDYKAATDNLNMDLQLEIMQVILQNSESSWCKKLWTTALRECGSHVIEYESFDAIEQSTGQLMGSLLSFPILCIINLAVFRSCFDAKKVLINGDDILFKATPGEYDVWSKSVSSVGLELSVGKNYYSSRYLTINSRFFFDGEEIEYLHLGRLMGPMNGDTYRKIPEFYKHLYKRYCKKNPGDLRDLLEPTCYGGLGGVTYDEYLRMVPTRRPSSLALHSSMVKSYPKTLLRLSDEVVWTVRSKLMSWIIPTNRRDTKPFSCRPKRGKLENLLEPRMAEEQPLSMYFCS